MVRGDELVVIVPRGRTLLALPKGRIDDGETAAQAAAREVREETGTTGDLLADLGALTYWYTRDGRRVRKIVHFFLFRYTGGDVSDHDAEVEEARWIPIVTARARLAYRGERDIVDRAIEALARLM